MRDYLCVTASQETDRLVLSQCEETSQWVYENNQLVWAASHTCLTLQPGGAGVRLAECGGGEDPRQQWHFTHYNPAGLPYRDLA